MHEPYKSNSGTCVLKLIACDGIYANLRIYVRMCCMFCESAKNP